MNQIKTFFRGMYKDPFKRYLSLGLIILGIFLLINSEEAPKACLGDRCEEVGKVPEYVTLPVLGQIRISDYSLPTLAIILGLVDGFNPCAMWVLVYLIGLVLTLKDRRKIWLLVGTFVLASAILYFLFMSAWLNAFLFVGYFRPVTILVGLVAVGGGAITLRDYIKTKGSLVCPVDDGSKKKTMNKIEQIIFAPLTLATIIGIIILAFVVNSIEFVCSSAIPAVFTQVLALHNLPTLQYYVYILLYDLFFMLDDLIIFGLAVFAVTSATSLGNKYAKYCKLLGGILLLIIGYILLFAPQLLR